MKLRKFNESKNKYSLKEFENIALESLTFVTDEFNNYDYDVWENDYWFFIHISFTFEFFDDNSNFDDQVNQIQHPLRNFNMMEERSKFWKLCISTKQQLETIFDKVFFSGKDLYDSKYSLTIKCER